MGKPALSLKVFEDSINEIEILFNKKLSAKQLQIYYNYLKKDFSNEIFIKTCKNVIHEERFFPTISAFYKKREISDDDQTWNAIL